MDKQTKNERVTVRRDLKISTEAVENIKRIRARTGISGDTSIIETALAIGALFFEGGLLPPVIGSNLGDPGVAGNSAEPK